MRPLFFVIFLASACVLSAGETQISGTVVDPAGRPVADALVACGGRNIVTDTTGAFQLANIAHCDATVTRPGFETAQTALDAANPNHIELTLASQSERVVVSATRTPVTLEESGVSATILNRRDIEARQNPPLYDLLRDVPGISIMSAGRRGAITSIFTRGGGSTSTLFLLDGIPVNDPGGSIDLANLTSAGLERVEAVRGSESTLFGAEAASGVVQMFTARGDSETSIPHGRLSYERGNLGTDHWTANLNGGYANRIDYSFTADQFHTAGMFPNDFYRNSNGTANIGFHITPNTEIRAIYRQFATEGGNPGQAAYGAIDRDAEAQNRDSALSLRLDDIRGAHFTQRVSFGYHRLGYRSSDNLSDGPYNIAALVRTTSSGVYLDRLVDPSFPASQVPAGDTLVKKSVTTYPYPTSSESDRKSLDYQGTLTHTGGTLVFGYEYERQEGLISGTTAQRDNNGGYVHEQYRWGKRIFLTGGARVEHSSTFGNKFAPRGSVTVALAGEHHAFTSTYLHFSAARGITEPSLLQNFAAESYYVGNPLLRPEKTTNYDLGLVQEMWGHRVRAEVTAFRNSFEDLIVYVSGAYPAPGSWQNVDRSWGRGAEATVSVRPMKYVQVSANWTRLDTKITRTQSTSTYAGVGQPLLRRPKNSGSAWISVSPRRWNFIAGGRFVGERQDSDFLFGLTRNPSYAVAWFSGSYRISKNIEPYVRIDNLFDEHYQEVLGYTSLSRNGVGGVRVTW